MRRAARLFLGFLAPVLCLLTSAPASGQSAGAPPPFPRIANCYGSGIAWASDADLRNYVSKLDLVIGTTGYDFHNDWVSPDRDRAYDRVRAAVGKLKAMNPAMIVLPYLDVIEGPPNSSVPAAFWKRDAQGQPVSTWPGFNRLDTDRKDVLLFIYQKIKPAVLEKPEFDGIFYDCWRPDPVLTAATVREFPGKAVMVNDWNLPASGMEQVNGALAEDEINRVMEGKVDFDGFVHRYLAWTSRSRTPHVTTIVCRPRTMNDDPWRWSRLTQVQRNAEMDAARTADLASMRFGLTTSMLGDGYFAYDAGTMARGNWWWYPEYDAKVGQPLSPAVRQTDGTWRREFQGGTVAVNGTLYDKILRFDRVMEDVSTGRVSRDFTLPSLDGRIFRPSAQSATPGPDAAVTFTEVPPVTALVKTGVDGSVRIQIPSGMEALVSPDGMLSQVRFRGSLVALGGNSQVVNPPWKEFRASGASVAVHESEDRRSVTVETKGTLAEGDSRLGYVSQITVGPGPDLQVELSFTALTALKVQMWRTSFSFPIALYQGISAAQGRQSVVLPETPGAEALLKMSGDPLVIEKDHRRATFSSSTPMMMTDLRKWQGTDYLWAGYPPSQEFAPGATRKIRMALHLEELN